MMSLLLDLDSSALVPACAIQQVAIRALPPRVGLGAKSHIRHVRSRVVMIVDGEVVSCDNGSQTEHHCVSSE